MKTKAQKLGITKFPYGEFDDKNNETYYEDSEGMWEKQEFDDRDNQTYFENETGFWEKMRYDKRDNLLSYKNASGCKKWEFDKNDNVISFVADNGYWYKQKWENKEWGGKISYEDAIGNYWNQKETPHIPCPF